jgi:hypothetical protein
MFVPPSSAFLGTFFLVDSWPDDIMASFQARARSLAPNGVIEYLAV